MLLTWRELGFDLPNVIAALLTGKLEQKLGRQLGRTAARFAVQRRNQQLVA